MSRFLSAVAAITLSASARDVTFPPIAGYQGARTQNALGVMPMLGGIDISTGSAFAGLTTFGNVDHLHCLSKEEDVGGYDIGILGAPFDTAVTGRPGARFGPESIRSGSRRIEAESGWSIYTDFNPYRSWAKIVDCGDAPLTFLDNTIALQQLDRAHEVISARKANSTDFTTPRIITLGGDHTTTLSALRSAAKHWGPVSVLHFDSHIDTWDPAVLGGGISHYAGVNHGTFLHIAHEEGLIRNTSMHAGIRAPVMSKGGDKRNDRRCGFGIITARDLDRFGMQGIIQRLKDHVKGTRVYITVDIDVLDPAYAPGTGTAEVGGWTTRELLTILDGLEGLDVVGADIVEVAPAYDNKGETTVLAASEIVNTFLNLMVKNPISP